MSRTPLTISAKCARRLAVTRQGLSGRLPRRPSKAAILSVVRRLAYVQWDPVTVVAPSHVLTLWARVGEFRPSDLDDLLWDERKLLLHWIPMATIVLTEDYPIYRSMMSRYPDSLSSSWGSHRTRAKRFLARHSELRKKMLEELRRGPLLLGQFDDHSRTKRADGDWTPASDVSQMLSHLEMQGEVMVVGHRGGQNLWGLSERFLPEDVDRRPLPEEAFEREAAQRALRALGTATPTEITYYFPRGRYDRLRFTLDRLEKDDVIQRVRIDGSSAREDRYVHRDDLPLLESVTSSEWEPRLSLLPPFDNLTASSARLRRIFDFEYVREQFLPKEKRRYGTYVLPILWGDRFVGRIDPQFDRSTRELRVNSVHAEPPATEDREIAVELSEAIARMATFLGANQVTYTHRVPEIWRRALR